MNKHLTLALAILAMPACAGMGNKYDSARASSVKKVVILGFEIEEQQPKDGLGVSGINDLKDGAFADAPATKRGADAIYAEFVKTLNARTHWQTAQLKDLQSNPQFAEYQKDKMSGLRQVTMTGIGSGGPKVEIIFPDGALDQTAFRKLTREQKVAFAKSFGADAYGEVMLYQTIEQSIDFGNFVGLGNFDFKTRANLRLFGLDSDEPIWQIQNVDGDSSFNSKTLPKTMPKRERLATVSLDSARSAIAKLVATYPGN